MTYQGLESFSRMKKIRLSPLDVELLMDMDSAVQAAIADKTKVPSDA